MSEKEIKEALEIIRKPITVNCEDYHYFDQENYDKLVSVYDNCRWFINNFEQVIDNCNELKSRIERAIEHIQKGIEAEDYVCGMERSWIDIKNKDGESYWVNEYFGETIGILKGEK